MSDLRIQPYILAGGRSSRMGQDKAMLQLGGKTLLARAVDLLMSVEGLRPHQGNTAVTIVGERARLEGAARAIQDGHAGCGPIGGMEAALRDLEEGDRGELAFFVPVDMPFLTPNLIEGFLKEWVAAAERSALACYVSLGATPQPLISLLHRSLRPFLSDALERSRLKVTTVLESALVDLALRKADSSSDNPGELRYVTDCGTLGMPGVAASSDSKDSQLEHMCATQHTSAPLWFTNVNTPEDFCTAETFFMRQGSSP